MGLNILVIIGLYLLGAALGWRAKEWHQGWPNQIFVAFSILATVGGILRGHLLFTERIHRPGLAAARKRAEPITWLVDVSIGLILIIDGAILVPTMEVAGVLVAALGVGLILARAVVEPSTTVAAFSSQDTWP